MADKYVVTKARLDGLAASIKELSGVATGLTPEQMQEQLDAANAEKEEQATIIGELASILAETSTVLDGKAGGSGGAAVETCNVEIRFSGNAAGYPGAMPDAVRASYSQFVSGSMTAVDETLSSDSVVLSNVPIGSIVSIFTVDPLSLLGVVAMTDANVIGYNDTSSHFFMFTPIGNNAIWEVM